VQNLASFLTPLDFEPLAFRNGARRDVWNLTQTRWAKAMVLHELCFLEPPESLCPF